MENYSSVSFSGPLEPTEGFALFVAVVEQGSISAASRALALPRSTLSRKLRELEASLGVKLLHRSTRKLELTEAGSEFYKRTRQILSAAAEARAAVRRLDGVPRGLLRLSVPPSFSELAEPLLLDYMLRYPETQLEVVSGAKFVDLRSDRVDVAFRAGQVEEPYLVVHEIFQTETCLVASPAYLDKFGRPTKPQELSKHLCLIGFEKGDFPRLRWPLRRGGSVPIRGRFTSNDLALLLAMARKAQGLALLPLAFSQALLERGELETVLRDQIGYMVPFSLVHASREFVSPKVRAFVDLALPYLRSELSSPPSPCQ